MGTVNTTTTPEISKRKQSHLDVCVKKADLVSQRTTAGFEEVFFFHNALPEIDFDAIDTKETFLNTSIDLPLFISCMTGGSDEGKKANRELAKAAEIKKIPLGLGSCRVLFEHPERFSDFYLRKEAPSIPLLANLGGVQLKKIEMNALKEMLKKLEVNALVIHLNPAQEMFQKGGDRDFTQVIDAISLAVEKLPLPVIVKETGFGISPTLVKGLLERGVAFVDVAGAGGTNWILVETVANDDPSGEEFINWGLPTAPLLDALDYPQKILASGGLRSGIDLAKSLALGAHLGGMALPFIQAAIQGGSEKVLETCTLIETSLKRVMLLTGCQNLKNLRDAPLIRSKDHLHLVEQISL